MFKSKQIRVLVGVIIKNGSKILVVPGIDQKKDEFFYRLIGGGVEFGEKLEEALRREIKEEIGSGLENISYLGFLENIFVYEGKNGHEIFFIYQGDLKNKEIYNKEEMPILDSQMEAKAIWASIDELKTHKFYPANIDKYI